MADKSVAEKARVKPGTRFAAVEPVEGVVESLGLPEPVFVDVPEADVVLLFCHSLDQLNAELPRAVETMPPGAVVWAFFRKGSKAAGLSMNRDDVWYAAERLDMRPLGILSVDDTWAVFRLRRG